MGTDNNKWNSGGNIGFAAVAMNESKDPAEADDTIVIDPCLCATTTTTMSLLPATDERHTNTTSSWKQIEFVME